MEFKVKCQTCSTELDIWSFDNGVVFVSPCENCLDDLRDSLEKEFEYTRWEDSMGADL